MAERDLRERDILVAANEYAYVQDLTKGDIVLYVGPTKISLSNTERLVEYREGRFAPVRSDDGGGGVSPFVTASSAQYVVLENPLKEAAARPVKGSNSSAELLTGRRVVVPGPATFPLWPGQRAKVLAGHELAEDQYLRIRVYDLVDGPEAGPIGTERIVSGHDVSFWIPRTGLEVLPDEKGAFVRNAVTLLEGQYCVLRGPRGRRRFVRGPGVVFPEAWEDFVTHEGRRAFAAFPLRRERGLHVRVLRSFEAKAGDQVPPGKYEGGQELFLSGHEGYVFPTEELEVLGEVAAIPLADKEAISVRDIGTGVISTIAGPTTYLPDPTRVELLSRPVPPEVAALWGLGKVDSKRAPVITIPPSYAVLVTGTHRREVVKGPQVRVLDHDEELEVLTLSTGTPKRDDALLPTCFLLVDGNRVSDQVTVRTSDHVELELELSYRVSFSSHESKPDVRWFNVKNYVALLCDHLGSIVRAAVRACPIELLHRTSTELIRGAILGKKVDAGRREGREFEENGMLVYDVEVLDVRILDEDVQKLLTDAQRTAIASEVTRRKEDLRLVNERAKEEVNRGIAEAQRATLVATVALEHARRTLVVAKAEATVEAQRVDVVGRAQNEAQALALSSAAQAEAQSRLAAVERTRLEASVEAFQKQMGALAPELIATLKSLGNQHLAAALTENLSPLAILGGGSVADVAERLLARLPVSLGALGGQGSDA